MLSFYERALRLAEKQFHVFPLAAGAKVPYKDYLDFPNKATTDEKEIKEMWHDPVCGFDQGYNIGIYTGRFNGGKLYPVGIDIDVKKDKKTGLSGFDSLLQWTLEGKTFPETYEQRTTSGGIHLVFLSEFPVPISAGKIAPGVDVRGLGGFLVGAGSVFEGKLYTGNDRPLVMAPDWLLELIGRAPAKSKPSRKVVPVTEMDFKRVEKQATQYLQNEAPAAYQGNRDMTAYTIACHLVKDLAVPEAMAVELMTEHWLETKCIPSLSVQEIEVKVRNALNYGRNEAGAESPDIAFKKEEPKIPDDEWWVDRLNREYAFIAVGRHHILHETKTALGEFVIQRYEEKSFHAVFRNQTVNVGEETKPISSFWMAHPKRRHYKGYCFEPGLKNGSGIPQYEEKKRMQNPEPYNLWHGFKVVPTPKGKEPSYEAKRGVERWLEHIHENVCLGIERDAQWLIGYFAQMIQEPRRNPQIAIVLKGEKGCGKNQAIDHIGHGLLGRHYFETSQYKRIMGRFNGSLENKIMVTLAEAFWAGAKDADSIWKDLITSEIINIEHKFGETFPISNYIRFIMTSNADWVVPATPDERRYAVFDVGNRRQGDKVYFGQMISDMHRGGYEYLLRTLMDWDYSLVDVMTAPETEALGTQISHGLNPLQAWWEECLADGCIVGVSTTWPTKPVLKNELRSGLSQYLGRRRVRNWEPSDTAMGIQFAKLGFTTTREKNAERRWQYVLPELGKARQDWEKYVKRRIDWNGNEGISDDR